MWFELLDEGEVETDTPPTPVQPVDHRTDAEGTILSQRTTRYADNPVRLEQQEPEDDIRSGAVVAPAMPHTHRNNSRFHYEDHHTHFRWSIVGSFMNISAIQRHKERVLDTPSIQQLIIQYSSFSVEAAQDLAAAILQLPELKVFCRLLRMFINLLISQRVSYSLQHPSLLRRSTP